MLTFYNFEKSYKFDITKFLSGMCSKDIRVVKLLAYNNIPFVLHSNQTDEEEEETYIFVSKKVKENVIIPIVNKKKVDHFTEISCSQNWASYIHCKKHFDLVHFFCPTHERYVYIVSLNDSSIVPLQVFDGKKDNGHYFGIKNKTITHYYSREYSKIIQTYLL